MQLQDLNDKLTELSLKLDLVCDLLEMRIRDDKELTNLEKEEIVENLQLYRSNKRKPPRNLLYAPFQTKTAV